jgi:hypothetical protein
MALCMTTSYGLQTTQMNEKPPQESSLNLILTQHPCDEDIEPRKVHPRLETKPLCSWYYHISSNFHTSVIMLQINLISSDEPEIICESFYEIKDISIFAWSSIPSFGHYR